MYLLSILWETSILFKLKNFKNAKYTEKKGVFGQNKCLRLEWLTES